MTAQIDDGFFYQGKQYSLAGISEGDVFDVSILDIKPSATCTACWRGYQAVFAVAKSRLVLDSLHVTLRRPGQEKNRYERVIGPVINGIAPAGPRSEHDWFNNNYERLAFHLEYSGGLLLADGFIQDLYVHMGFHPAWKYKTVIELVFDGGVLKQEFDRSERMAEIREMFITSQSEAATNERPTKEEIKQFVERAFDRSYTM
ncbi:MAG: hypothetical protein C5B58_01735 [Acidobacteria bacterium]|nr:MAG: hypothetical protein C5B58_01735 [Acidobacteriota bacterium]